MVRYGCLVNGTKPESREPENGGNILLSMKRVLDIGCGKDKHRIAEAKVVGVDMDPYSDADVTHDLNSLPWPFNDNEFDEVICQDILEHLDNIMSAMQEISRISRQGSAIKIRTPHYSSYYAYNDPSHKHRFGYYTFEHFCDVGFRVIRKEILFPRIWRILGLGAFFNRFPRRWEQLLAFTIRAENMYIELENVGSPTARKERNVGSPTARKERNVGSPTTRKERNVGSPTTRKERNVGSPTTRKEGQISDRETA